MNRDTQTAIAAAAARTAIIDRPQPNLQAADFERVEMKARGGSTGRVFVVRRKSDGCVFSVKAVETEYYDNRSPGYMLTDTLEQLEAMLEYPHPNIVMTHGFYLRYQPFSRMRSGSAVTSQMLGVVMDNVTGGELFDYFEMFKVPKSSSTTSPAPSSSSSASPAAAALSASGDRPFPLHVVRFYAAELMSALDACHTLYKIRLRMLDPERLLLDKNGHLVLLAFHAPVNPCAGGPFCACPDYMAPELLCGEEHTDAVDYWSAGVILFELLTGMLPFPNFINDTSNVNHLYQDILKTPLEPELAKIEDVGARDFISRLLCRDPTKRLRDFDKDVKLHPFFAAIDWNSLPVTRPPIVPTSRVDPRFNGSQNRELQKRLEEEAEADFESFVYTNP